MFDLLRRLSIYTPYVTEGMTAPPAALPAAEPE
jgi:hypothetical protein